MEEKIDVLDEFGKLTGEIVTSSAVHRIGLWHRVIKVVVLNKNNELLAQKRSKTKKIFPNVWDIAVTGHVSAGETSIDAVKRELFEEIGLNIDKNKIKYLFSYKKDIGYNDFKEKMFIDLYFVKLDITLQDIKILEDEVDEIKFVALENSKNLINDDFFLEDGEFDSIINGLKEICYDN